MRGRPTKPRNPLSARIAGRRRELDLSRRWFKEQGLGVIAHWERAKHPPFGILTDRREATLIRRILDLELKDLLDIVLRIGGEPS